MADHIALMPMTRERMHEMFRDFAADPDLFIDMALYERARSCAYTRERLDALFDRREAEADCLSFAVMLNGEVIGEVCLKHIDRAAGECALSIHLKNDAVKNKGYGTRAERLAVEHAFGALGLKRVCADCVIKNTRSQRVLEKVGFRFLREADGFRYYAIDA